MAGRPRLVSVGKATGREGNKQPTIEIKDPSKPMRSMIGICRPCRSRRRVRGSRTFHPETKQGQKVAPNHGAGKERATSSRPRLKRFSSGSSFAESSIARRFTICLSARTALNRSTNSGFHVIGIVIGILYPNGQKMVIPGKTGCVEVLGDFRRDTIESVMGVTDVKSTDQLFVDLNVA